MSVQAPVDLVSLLEQDHQVVQDAFREIDQAGAERLPELFWSLTELMVRHEVAEEIVVYPALKKLPAGKAIANARIAEQSAAEEDLARMEKLDPRSEEFAEALGALEQAVLEHAQREEKEAFPLLVNRLTSEDLVKMGERYIKAKNASPTHPHPHAPDTPPGNRVMGPVAALVDRIRDAGRSVYMG